MATEAPNKETTDRQLDALGAIIENLIDVTDAEENSAGMAGTRVDRTRGTRLRQMRERLAECRR